MRKRAHRSRTPRTDTITFRVSTEEKTRLEDAAIEAGMTLSGYLAAILDRRITTLKSKLAEMHEPQMRRPEREIKRGPQKERVSEAFETAARKPEPEAVRPFREAAKPETISRAEQIRRDMEAWRQRHGGRDMGREL